VIHRLCTIAGIAKIRKTDNLIRFANLVAKNERELTKEGIAKFCEQIADRYEGKTISSKNLRILAEAIRAIKFKSIPWRKK
jgi:phosphopantothenate synthetase